MKLLLVAPHVNPRRAVFSAGRCGAGLVFMTHPSQVEAAVERGLSQRIVVDDNFLPSNEDLQALVAHCKQWARAWHDEPPLKKLSMHGGVRCSELMTQSLTVVLVEILKPVHIVQQILDQNPISEIETSGGGPWAEAAVFLAHRRNLAVKEDIPEVTRVPRGSGIVGLAKTVLAQLNRWLRPARRGAVIYSSAIRYVRPLLEKEGGVYLRDTFSVEAFLASFRGNFEHVLPDYFGNRAAVRVPAAEAADSFFRVADAWFSEHAYFGWKDENLWPLLRERVNKLVENEMKNGMVLIDRFRAMFEKISPRAVVVDEEVCFFNKTLVQTANACNIQTFSLVHGDPYQEIGSLPSSVSRILAWGPCTAQRLAGWGADPAKIIQTGAPQFTAPGAGTVARWRRAVIRHHKIPVGAAIALYAACSYSLNDRATFLRPSFGEKMQQSGLRVVLAAMRRHPSLHLIIKFHPFEEHEALTRRFVDEAGIGVSDRVRFVRRYDATRLIAASDLVLVIASTIYAESLLWRKPVLAFYDKDFPFLPSGPQWQVDMDDDAQCAAAIDACLDPARSAEIRARIETQIEQYFSEGNRNAAERTLAAIQKTVVSARAGEPIV